MRSGGTAVRAKRRPNTWCVGSAVCSDPESFPPSGREPGVRSRLLRGVLPKHGRGMLHVWYRPIIRSQLGLIVRREGSVVMFNELERGSHQVYLCHAPSAVLEGGANKIPVSIWHTCRLCARGKVAG